MIFDMHEPHFVEAHISGLWDAPRGRWVALLKTAARAADVITVTEFTQDPTGDWVPEGFAKVHFTGLGRNECAIFYRIDTFPRALERWCIPISKTPYALGSGKVRPRVHLLGVELEHHTGRKVNIEVFHTPSAIEGRNALIRGVRRTKALLECFSSIQTHKRAELRGEANLLAADWNLNLKLAWVRALLKVRLRGWHSAWRKMPSDGSHGERLIDGVRVSRQLRVLGTSRLANSFAPFDHRMVLTVIGWRPTKR